MPGEATAKIRATTAALVLISACGCSQAPAPTDAPQVPSAADVLDRAPRIPVATSWFEVIKLPGDVYAFWEPGHAEQVSSFLILGSTRDLLYDTGMGIASLGDALRELRTIEGLPARELMVVNSHAHLDHIGSNDDFALVHILRHDWAIAKLTTGILAGSGFAPYYSELTGQPPPPVGFSPDTHGVPPIAHDRIRFLSDGQEIDLGNRSFRVIATPSHTPDSICLYDQTNGTLFTGDVFTPTHGFLTRSLTALEHDVARLAELDVETHYNTHGPQLLDRGARAQVLDALRQSPGREATTVTFSGVELPAYRAGGFVFILGENLILY